MASLSYHWTPELEARFLEQLSLTGSVRMAAKAVGMSPKSAYARRRRCPGFANQWLVTLEQVRNAMIDVMLDAAMYGMDYRPVRNPDTGRQSWRRADPRLSSGRGLSLLTRLDHALQKRG